ncbi:hypothetical protein J4E83_010582 [Alternaria metachromatica]|uniref:uncharacterized protein n=1 Tax=Alternaria metachromatica TaxID=283354 RepID=UPI0020C435FC|nr:uncharacterized protein J4E83_010582 [Alternaria metachromatica]KAI4605589.1 hypothetical protein J4E83_010582 [Alternaria metachromatica]
MSGRASSTFIGDNTHGSTLNQGSIVTGDSSHVGNINHFHTATQEDSARKSCLRDLLAALGDDPDDYRQMLEDRKGPKTLGTCEWVSWSVEYNNWATKSSGLLWISGDAGKGKTMLALNLVSTLKTQSSAGYVVHFFCSRDHGKNTGCSILRGIIYQLLVQKEELFEHISDDYEKHGASLFDDRKFQALWAIFARIIHDHNVTCLTCILDGLDECDEEGLEDFWTKIETLYKADPKVKPGIRHHSLRLLIVSRNHPYSIQRALEDCPRLRFEGKGEYHMKSDIYKFIDDRMAGLKCPSETRTHIKEKLCGRAESTYLWVGFAINALKKVRVIDMEKTVESFPRGLDAMYRRMLLAITDHERARVIEILRWIIVAFRPLNLRELAIAVNTSPAKGQSMEDAITDEVAYAGDLLVMERNKSTGNQVVRLVHSSVLDFFRSIHQSDVSLEFFMFQEIATHNHVTQSLFDYMFHTFCSLPHTGGDVTPFEYRAQFQKKEYPLFEYALTYGVEHLLRIGDVSLIENYHQLLDPAEEYHAPWLQHTCCAMYGHKPREGVTVAHLAALGGLIIILDYLHTKQYANINAQDGSGRTLLFYATLRCQVEMMAWLLLHGADPNLQDSNQETPLHIAAGKNRLDVVELLINHGAQTCIQSSSSDLRRGLIWGRANDEFARLGVGYRGGTPVRVAAINVNFPALPTILARFLQEGGSINDTDEDGCTVLHEIGTFFQEYPRRSWKTLSELFKSFDDFDPDILDDDGESALHIASRGEYALHVSGQYFNPPMSYPNNDGFDDDDEDSRERDWNAVSALIELFGAAVDIRTSTGATPLHLACKKVDPSLVEYLLRKGADPRLYDQSGQNALHWLCSQRQNGFDKRPEIWCMLAQGMTLVDIEARMADGQTARDLVAKFEAKNLGSDDSGDSDLEPDVEGPAEPVPQPQEESYLLGGRGRPFAFSGDFVFIQNRLLVLIDDMLVLIKSEPSSRAFARLQRLVEEKPHMQHLLEKNRLYWESQTKERWRLV